MRYLRFGHANMPIKQFHNLRCEKYIFYLFDAHFFIKNPQAGSSLLKLKKLRSQKVRRRMTISNNNLPFN